MSSQTMPEIQGTETPGRSRPHKQCLKYKVQKLQVGHVLTNNA